MLRRRAARGWPKRPGNGSSCSMTPTNLRVFDGAVAIVTGGASGIGRALSEELARRGAAVTLADLQAEEAGAVATALRASGWSASAAALDVTDYVSVKRLVERVA